MKRIIFPLCAYLVLLSLPPSAFGEVRVIKTAFLKKDYKKVKTVAKMFLERDPIKSDADQANYYLAMSHLHSEEYLQAKKILNKLISNKPKLRLRDRAYLALFDSYYLSEDYKQAKKTIDKLMQISQRSAYLSTIYLKAARVNLKLSNWKEARGYLHRVTNDFPDSLEVHNAKQLLEERQYFAVQVGAYLERERAQKQVDELKRKGEYAYVVVTRDQNGKRFYRVRVGQLARLTQAQRLESKLSQQGYPTKIYP